MEKKKLFTGAATALITPLTPEGVDYPRLAKLIDWQIEQGINAAAQGCALIGVLLL